jgi:hypothetical protein
MLPVARSNAEAHLYMARVPCGCGARGFTAAGLACAVAALGEQLISRYTGACAGCGVGREFEFPIPDELVPPPGRGVRFGGDAPSQLFDPGEWLAIADEHALRVPAGDATARIDHARDLAIAVAAIDEILKFIPPGAEACPGDRFRSAPGRAIHAAEPGRFRRVRLQATRDALARGLRGSDAAAPHPDRRPS